MSNPKLTKLWFQENGQNFKTAPLEKGWNYTSKRNKAGLISFISEKYLQSGTQIKLTGNFPTIGGIIVKIEQTKEDLNKYTAVDYKTYLMGEINYTAKKKVKAHHIMAGIKKYAPELNWKIGKTSKSYKQSLVWKKKTVLQIINELIWLEWTYAKKLIYFNVDHNRNLIFKYYPQQIDGYSFHQAHKYSNTYDASQITTGWRVVDENGKLVAKYNNKELTAKYGHIISITSSDKEDNKTSSSSDSNIKKGSFKPSCIFCSPKVPYTSYTTSFKDKCTSCGATGLKKTTKGDAPEGQWTCPKCDMDFCGVCGGEKWKPQRASLHQVDVPTKVKRAAFGKKK